MSAPDLPVQRICNELSDLRDQLLLLSMAFNQQDEGQKIQPESVARAIQKQLVDMMIQTDTLRSNIQEIEA
ncbi:MAG: hypothetical protein JJU24_10190 [Natronohydrobacter sp.]|nr:hypothetical protein [Natronohydrobacter sp.]